MKLEKRFLLLLALAAMLFSACEKADPNPPQPYNPQPYVPVDPNPPSVYKWGLEELAQANHLLLGTEFTFGEYGTDSIKVILNRDFEAVTFGNEMKHDCIVMADGFLNFGNADTMVGWAKKHELKLFGHTLGWHSQQQADYLNALIDSAPDAETAAARVREAHKTWVEAMIEHFDVYGWDVVNETFTDNGQWRDESNTEANYHVFLWGSYYPGGTEEFVKTAFRTAREALEREGKTADLYINDYNLEGGWATGKLEALCSFAEKNPDVTGVGTQMHISADLDRSSFVHMLERMVQTKKKVRISELDIATGNTDQGETLVYIFDQYLKLVPEDQRGGITFWGIDDGHSWLGENKHALLYDKLYKRKDCYRKLHAYLLERSGLDQE